MLRYLLGTDEPRVQDIAAFPQCRASDRKLRLFACACYQRIGHVLPEPLARAALAVAERYADGLASAEELQQMERSLSERLDALEPRWRASRGAERAALHVTYAALALAYQVCHPQAPKGAYYASSNAYLDTAALANPGAAPSDPAFGACQRVEEQAQCELLRCIIGPTALRSLLVDPSWRTPPVLALARHAYDQRAFDLLPAVGAALSDAGCTDGEILSHCASPGPHVRGCFVLDAVLDRDR